MQYEQTTFTEGTVINRNDDVLWRIAKKRAAFKVTAITYLLVNSFLVATWYFTAKHNTPFWPIWPILGWGLGLTIQYFSAYHSNNLFSIEKEYQKLKNKQ